MLTIGSPQLTEFGRRYGLERALALLVYLNYMGRSPEQMDEAITDALAASEGALGTVLALLDDLIAAPTVH